MNDWQRATAVCIECQTNDALPARLLCAACQSEQLAELRAQRRERRERHVLRDVFPAPRRVKDYGTL